MPKNRMKLKNKGDFRFLSTLFRFTHHSYSIFVHFSPDDAVRFNPLLFDDWRIAVRFSVIYAVKFFDDMTDTQFLAEQMRLNALESTRVLEKQRRAIQDHVRFRGALVQDRARYKTIFKNFLNNQYYLKLTPDTHIAPRVIEWHFG